MTLQHIRSTGDLLSRQVPKTEEKMKSKTNSRPAFSIENPSNNYGRQRLKNFGTTMMVMGASFICYYLGLFGNVEGPLQPEKLGEALSGFGISQRHMLIAFLVLTIIAITWNWILNLVCFLTGARRTCIKVTGTGGKTCGAPVTNIQKNSFRKSGTPGIQYVCVHGHKCFKADFHAVKKGVVGHTLWALFLTFSIMVLFMS